MGQQATNTAGDRSVFHRMAPHARVGLNANACIARHAPVVTCDRCVQGCPRRCLAVSDGALVLDAMSCSGCGHCAAVCPSGALVIEGFRLPANIAADGVAVVCERMPAASCMATHRIPCLSGLSLNDWLRLALVAGDHALCVPDAAVCSGCANAPRSGMAWTTALAIAQRTMKAAGTQETSLRITIAVDPLPDGNTPKGTHREAMVSGRRSFFSGVSRAVAAAVNEAVSHPARRAESRSSGLGQRKPGSALPGDETRELMLKLAHARGEAPPREAFLPTLSATDACRAHGACVQVCPTGALQLQRSSGGDTARLLFDAWRCVECGACARLCPEHALNLEARDWRTFPHAPTQLAAVREKACVRCGALVATDEDDTLCDRCRKTEGLARAGCALFSRARHTWPATPEGP